MTHPPRKKAIRPAAFREEQHKDLLRRLIVQHRRWNQHLLFLAREYATGASICTDDLCAPISDVLVTVDRAAQLIIFRLWTFNRFGFTNRDPPEDTSPLQRLLDLLDEQKFEGLETEVSHLRRAAAGLADDIAEKEEELEQFEAQFGGWLEELVHDVGRSLRREARNPTEFPKDLIERDEQRRERMSREPEDAVWAAKEWKELEVSLSKSRDLVKQFERRQRWWNGFLHQAAKLNIHMGGRQAFNEDYFGPEEDEVDSEDGDGESGYTLSDDLDREE